MKNFEELNAMYTKAFDMHQNCVGQVMSICRAGKTAYFIIDVDSCIPFVFEDPAAANALYSELRKVRKAIVAYFVPPIKENTVNCVSLHTYLLDRADRDAMMTCSLFIRLANPYPPFMCRFDLPCLMEDAYEEWKDSWGIVNGRFDEI